MKYLYLFLFTFISLSAIGQTAAEPSGSGTATDPYLISSLNELYWVSEQTFSTLDWSNGKYFLQTKDIDASDATNWSTGWIPIGGRGSQTLVSDNNIFKGIYNGDNHSISNILPGQHPDQKYLLFSNHLYLYQTKYEFDIQFFYQMDTVNHLNREL